LFVGGEGGYRHGMRPVAKLSRQYNEQLKRLAAAEAKQAITTTLPDVLQIGSLRLFAFWSKRCEARQTGTSAKT
jgi:hypothetical protein